MTNPTPDKDQPVDELRAVIFPNWRYSKPTGWRNGLWRKSRPGYLQNVMTEAEMRNILKRCEAHIQAECNRARKDVLEQLNLYYMRHDGEGEHQLAAQFDVMLKELEDE